MDIADADGIKDMNGFSLPGVMGDIPCPHCGATGCRSGGRAVCGRTGKKVSTHQLERSAERHGMTRYDRIDLGEGWELQVLVRLSTTHAAEYGIGSALIVHREFGTCGCSATETGARDAVKRLRAGRRRPLAA